MASLHEGCPFLFPFVLASILFLLHIRLELGKKKKSFGYIFIEGFLHGVNLGKMNNRMNADRGSHNRTFILYDSGEHKTCSYLLLVRPEVFII